MTSEPDPRRAAGPDLTTRRPLTARSVVASTLLGVDPPRLPGQALVRSGELFGLREGATRTALSRMAVRGEVVADDGDYVLSGPLLERHARQQEARRSVVRDWDGTWEMAVVRVDRRSASERAELREAARRRNLAEIREGCWARPANLDPDRAPGAASIVEAQCVLVSGARPDPVEPFVAAFAPAEWADQATALVGEMARTQHLLDDRDASALGPTFVLSAAVLRHLVADPVLPPGLRPEGWPAEGLRATFARYDEGFKATWRAWYRTFRST